MKKLFDVVPDRYLNIVAGIEQFYDLKKLPFDEAVGRLRSARGGEQAVLGPRVGKYCSPKQSGKPDRGPQVVNPLGGEEEAVEGVAVVVVAPVEAVVELSLGKTAPGRKTRVI